MAEILQRLSVMINHDVIDEINVKKLFFIYRILPTSFKYQQLIPQKFVVMAYDVTYKTSLSAVNQYDNNMLNKQYLYSDDSHSIPFCSIKLRTQKKKIIRSKRKVSVVV